MCFTVTLTQLYRENEALNQIYMIYKMDFHFNPLGFFGQK